MTQPLRTLRPDQRLAMLGGLLAVLVAVLLTLQVRDTRQLLHTIDSGRDAASLATTLIDVVLQTQRHRGLAGSVLGGATDAEAQRAASQDAVEHAMQRFDGLLARHGPDARMRDDWRDIGTEWRGLAAAVAQRQIGAVDSLARHTALIEAELELHDRLLVRFGHAAAPAAAPAAWAQALRPLPRLVEALERSDAGAASLPALRVQLQALVREQAAAADRQAAAQRQAVVRAQVVQAAGLLLVLLLALGMVWKARAPAEAAADPGPGDGAPPEPPASRREGERVLQRLAATPARPAAPAQTGATADAVREGDRSVP